ncbi:MAG: acyl carrier protein [Candidatus Magnetoglobus multicellularis str. Araruama]|uniref:Acyl carrier protein n=1 Tax=Candidatus Magnetoglobus multicellularis str. Araruama TaxID=890399 RepID=A0A1V1P2F5_9BACT|nr:MAG: acyl carrier protein [Candidatus Magnetoglobus multicellularis str. Araruama]
MSKDDMETIQETIYEILRDILDIEKKDIQLETFLIRDLDAESIDLLELAVSINQQFNITVNEDELFLRKLRLFLETDSLDNPEKILQEKYPFLTSERITQILEDLADGPVLKVKDIIHYVSYTR